MKTVQVVMWKLKNWSLATNAHKLMQNIRTDVSCRECTLFLMCQSEQIQPAKIFHYINLHLAPHLEHDLSVETQERWNSWMLVSCFHPKHDSFTLPPCLHFLYLSQPLQCCHCHLTSPPAKLYHHHYVPIISRTKENNSGLIQRISWTSWNQDKNPKVINNIIQDF